MNHLPKILFKVIPHSRQRYNTCGDYYKKFGAIQFRVSKMTFKYEFLIFIHELIEWMLITIKGISIKEIDDFDINYENNRIVGDDSEPGDDPFAPYYDEHRIATQIEKLLAKHLNVDWELYSKAVKNL